jgi:hypothetical protein
VTLQLLGQLQLVKVAELVNGRAQAIKVLLVQQHLVHGLVHRGKVFLPRHAGSSKQGTKAQEKGGGTLTRSQRGSSTAQG